MLSCSDQCRQPEVPSLHLHEQGVSVLVSSSLGQRITSLQPERSAENVRSGGLQTNACKLELEPVQDIQFLWGKNRLDLGKAVLLDSKAVKAVVSSSVRLH